MKYFFFLLVLCCLPQTRAAESVLFLNYEKTIEVNSKMLASALKSELVQKKMDAIPGEEQRKHAQKELEKARESLEKEGKIKSVYEVNVYLGKNQYRYEENPTFYTLDGVGYINKKECVLSNGIIHCIMSGVSTLTKEVASPSGSVAVGKMLLDIPLGLAESAYEAWDRHLFETIPGQAAQAGSEHKKYDTGRSILDVKTTFAPVGDKKVPHVISFYKNGTLLQQSRAQVTADPDAGWVAQELVEELMAFGRVQQVIRWKLKSVKRIERPAELFVLKFRPGLFVADVRFEPAIRYFHGVVPPTEEQLLKMRADPKEIQRYQNASGLFTPNPKATRPSNARYYFAGFVAVITVLAVFIYRRFAH